MSKYTDVKNNTYNILQKTVLLSEDKDQIENEIVEELYKIFTHK